MGKEKKIIVAGGAGYLGSHTVVELIEQGFEPVIIDNFSNSHPDSIKGIEAIVGRKIKVYEADCRNRKKLFNIFSEEGDIYGVIHFAAYKSVEESSRFPLLYYDNNVGSLLAMLNMVERFEIENFVFSSSCAVYGSLKHFPVQESTVLGKAESPYGMTKQVCEQIIEDFVESNDSARAAALRYFNPIGAHPSGSIGELSVNTPDNLVPYLTQTALNIQSELTIHGGDYDTEDGTCVRDYIHVMDLAKAHVRALGWMGQQAPKGLFECFNIGTGKGASVMEVVKTFESVSGLGLNYKVGPRRKGDIPTLYAATEKARTILGWSAERTLREALGDAWHWQLQLAETEVLAN